MVAFEAGSLFLQRHTNPGTLMRLLSAALFLTLSVTGCTAAAAPAPQQVDILARDLKLHARLYKPDGNGPFPAVIGLHACGGLSGNAGAVLPRYRDWAEQLVKAGYAVLLPDSFGSRDLGPQCRTRERKVLARRERVADISAARQWLLQQGWVARDRISLIGWAHGASAVLWAVRPQQATRAKEPDYRSAIAFYPECRVSAGTGWSARVPTLLLIGARDDISSPPSCRQMVDNARGRSALARIVVYPDAQHDFDRADLPLRALASSDASAPDHGHVGSDAEARADAARQVLAWLAR